MKALTDSQLKKSSILDFTTDLLLIRKVLENEYFKIEDSNMWVDSDRMLGLLSFAQYTQDEKLLKDLKSYSKTNYQKYLMNKIFSIFVALAALRGGLSLSG